MAITLNTELFILLNPICKDTKIYVNRKNDMGKLLYYSIPAKLNCSRRRDKNNPANVLSFRYGSDYGEILVCPEVIRKEAEKQGNSSYYQMTWMILHGMLHLGGMHHEESGDIAKKTERIEKEILSKIDFVN